MEGQDNLPITLWPGHPCALRLAIKTLPVYRASNGHVPFYLQRSIENPESGACRIGSAVHVDLPGTRNKACGSIFF